jgi:hypothetical protein
MWMKKMALGLLAMGAIVPSTSDARAALAWSPWVSEEYPHVTGCADVLNNAAAVGFGCSGKYCDNVRLLCETLPFGATPDYTTSYWTSLFSEETDGFSTWSSEGWYHYDGDNYEVCHATDNYPGFVTSILCNGSYCDNIALQCVQAKKSGGIPVHVTSCGWTGWYSEEQGSVDFGYNRYITGVECQGSYCDNKRFYVCSMVNPI